jgi:acetyl esterase
MNGPHTEGRARSDPEPDTATAALLQIMAAAATPAIWTLGADEARRLHDPLTAQSSHRAPALRSVRDITLADRIHGRIYRDHEATPSGLLVYFHGGGGVIGNLDTHDAICRTLCASSGLAVLAVDYRLGPEHPFPAAWEDAWAAYCWAHENAQGLGICATAITVGGDSAGGGLAAAVAQAAAATGRPCAGQLLLYPALDATRDSKRYPSVVDNADGYFLTRELMDWFTRHYLAKGQDRAALTLSPALAGDLRGLPPTLLVTAGFDPLRDEAHHYATALAAAGVSVEQRCATGTIHGFLSFGRFLPQAEPLLRDCGAALARLSGLARR